MLHGRWMLATGGVGTELKPLADPFREKMRMMFHAGPIVMQARLAGAVHGGFGGMLGPGLGAVGLFGRRRSRLLLGGVGLLSCRLVIVGRGAPGCGRETQHRDRCQ